MIACVLNAGVFVVSVAKKAVCTVACFEPFYARSVREAEVEVVAVVRG